MLLTLFLMSVYDLFLTGKKKIIKQYHRIHFVKGYVCVCVCTHMGKRLEIYTENTL